MGFANRYTKQACGLAALAVITIAATAQWAKPDTPAYHMAAPRGPMPKLLAESERTGVYFTRPYQAIAYRMADAIPEVLYQLPCYCRCDRAIGHKSLHSCFEGSHAAVCTTCMSEAAYAYSQHKEGKTVAQIRAGIERGDWQEVALTDLTDSTVSSTEH